MLRFNLLVGSLVLLSPALTACQGTMAGNVRGTNQQIQVAYTEGFASDTLEVTMPDGEMFKGRAVMQGRTTTMGHQNLYGTATGPRGMVQANVFGSSSSNTYTGQMGAVLLGNRGRSMRCQFQYASTTGMTSAGGAGICQVSDGKEIDIVW